MHRGMIVIGTEISTEKMLISVPMAMNVNGTGPVSQLVFDQFPNDIVMVPYFRQSSVILD